MRPPPHSLCTTIEVRIGATCGIVPLIAFQYPLAILFGIVQVRIFPLQGQPRLKGLAHIFLETFKLKPFITYHYSTSSVMFKRPLFRIITPRFHTLPSSVNLTSRHTVGSAERYSSGLFSAATRPCLIIFETVSTDSKFLSADTSTKPKTSGFSPTLFKTCYSQYCQIRENLTRKVLTYRANRWKKTISLHASNIRVKVSACLQPNTACGRVYLNERTA